MALPHSPVPASGNVDYAAMRIDSGNQNNVASRETNRCNKK